ncbi:carboxymethylenebutenolidase [Kibdelosporangium banguiense]|uniref:Carboxymethylenebutenolidase n=1 Tax=Kibdelosporangium banguiense TaxID=1365924 RepID=A0ABS4T8T2_9PSEU|nr:dienelactone hydrolase family protein [Kibdelosporangium banguiense]MBP2320243.1 carboxymethylenebutenolidase [Kibdelosporangium banguiense]
MSVWMPAAGRGPAVLVLQEIFGVGEYIEAVADDLTKLGYVVVAPDLFWREHRNWRAAHDDQGLSRSMDLAGKFDLEQGVSDIVLACQRLYQLPEVDGGVAVLGFCFGGTLAFMTAAAIQPAAVVSYYGSGVPDQLDLLEKIKSPLQLQFGGQDPYIPAERIADVADAVEQLDHVELHVQEGAGHAFHNRVAPQFHQPDAAARAWALTVEFLERHL